jgi:hypothetical protein
MTIETGKTYVDEHNSRRIVVAIDGGQVTYVLPISRRQASASLADFEAWAVGEYVDPFA